MSISPKVYINEKKPYTASVSCSNDLKAFTEDVEYGHGDIMAFFKDDYFYFSFDVGNWLCDALTRSVEKAYLTVTYEDTASWFVRYDRKIEFSLEDGNLKYSISLGHGKVEYYLWIYVREYDVDGNLIRFDTECGHGFSEGYFGWDLVEVAIVCAIQEVCDKVAVSLASN